MAVSLSKIKDSIIEALREENSLLHQKIEKLESRISVLETDLNKQDQYIRHNNLDIQGIPDSNIVYLRWSIGRKGYWDFQSNQC